MKNTFYFVKTAVLSIAFCTLISVNAQTTKPAQKPGAGTTKTQVTTKAPVKKAPEKEASKQITKKYSVYFDVNQSKIKTDDYKILDSVVDILKSQTNIRRIQITGYADTTGGAEANMILSDNRTDTVAGYILSKNLMQFKSRISTSSQGEKVTGKETDLNEMRRVDIVLVLSKPDRDTVIKSGCVTATIKANTFEGFNNDEISFKIEYINTAADAKKYNIVFKDDKGKSLLSNSVVRIIATYKGKPVKAVQPVLINVPKVNKESDYSLYKGIEDKSKVITWKLVEGNVINIGLQTTSSGENCDLQSVSIKDLNVFYNICKFTPACYCSTDPFGGLQTPESNNTLSRVGPEKTIVLLNDAVFKKLDANTTYLQVVDNLFPAEYLNFCNSFLLPGLGNVPQIAKYDREILKFIDFNVSNKNDSADMIMVKKTKILVMIPKSKYPAHEGKQYALLHADTKKDNFQSWTNKVTFNEACQGLSNCDYWVFEVPFSGFYTLLELTPAEKGNNNYKIVADGSDDGGSTPKYVKVKSKKFNDVSLIYGLKSEDNTKTAKFLKNKGKHTFNQPEIPKKDKKEYADHVFLAYVVKDGKRYAWIGKGSELKTNFLTGNWKTPKLVYVPDEEWEEFIKKACE